MMLGNAPYSGPEFLFCACPFPVNSNELHHKRERISKLYKIFDRIGLTEYWLLCRCQMVGNLMEIDPNQLFYVHNLMMSCHENFVKKFFICRSIQSQIKESGH